MTPVEASAKIKRHIKERDNDNCYEVTENVIVFWFELLNVAIFNDSLPMPKSFSTFEYKEQNQILGFCSHRYMKDTITIAMCKEFADRKTFLTVLVHEMVHMHQTIFRTTYPYHSRMTHGKSFYEWRDTIKRTVGLPLGEYA